MINSIYGTLTGKYPQIVYIESNGIEWELNVSDSTLNSLPSVGSTTRIFCVLQHKEDSMKLFGFASVEERSVFQDLLKVDGVGPKGALKILSNMPYENLIKILEDEDISRLEKVPGVGKKTAQKMLLSLKGKLSLFSEDTKSVSAKKGEWEDIIVALVEMGYERKKCEQVVEQIAKDLDESLASAQKEEILFRKAIMELSL